MVPGFNQDLEKGLDALVNQWFRWLTSTSKQCSLSMQNDRLHLNDLVETLDLVDSELSTLKHTDGKMLEALKKETNMAAGSFNGIETNEDHKADPSLRVVLCDRMRAAVRDSFKHIRDSKTVRAGQVFQHSEILLVPEDEIADFGNKEIKFFIIAWLYQ